MKTENRHNVFWHPMYRLVRIGFITKHGVTEERHRTRC